MGGFVSGGREGEAENRDRRLPGGGSRRRGASNKKDGGAQTIAAGPSPSRAQPLGNDGKSRAAAPAFRALPTGFAL